MPASDRAREAYVLPELTPLSLRLAPLLRALSGRDVYYVEVAPALKSRPDLLAEAEAKGVRWIKKEYRRYTDFSRGGLLAFEMTEALYGEVRGSALLGRIESTFSDPARLRPKLDVLWKRVLLTDLERFSRQVAAAEWLTRQGGCARATVLALDGLASLWRGTPREGVDVVRLPWVGAAGLLWKLLARLAGRRERPAAPQAPSAVQGPGPGAPPEDLGSFRAVFFPHQGVYFGKLFLKDHFYSDDPASPFARTNLLHVSIDEKGQDFMADSYRYYAEHRIPHADTQDLCCGWTPLLGKALRMLAACPLELWRFGPAFCAMALRSYLKIERWRSMVSKCSSLRVALVGYEILFPRELAAVLSDAGVQVCASQERLITLFTPETPMSYFALDHFFVSGRVVVEEGLRRHAVGRCHRTGLIRTDKLFEHEKHPVRDEKYDGIKARRKLVLALDYHVAENEVEDIDREIAKVSEIRRFYEDLLRLAADFPSLHIVIKGKFRDNYKSPFIADLVERIRARENMGIELDLERYTPYFLGEKADLTLACHTSLADELMAAGRKVVFYEATDYLESFFTYRGLPYIVKDYDGLRLRVEEFLRGEWLSEEKARELRKDFYSDAYHGHVGRDIRGILERILRGEA